ASNDQLARLGSASHRDTVGEVSGERPVHTSELATIRPPSKSRPNGARRQEGFQLLLAEATETRTGSPGGAGSVEEIRSVGKAGLPVVPTPAGRSDQPSKSPASQQYQGHPETHTRGEPHTEQN